MKIVAIDTEFSRDRTYYPMLSIVQIKTNKNSEELIFDVLQDDANNIEKLLEILTNNDIIKIIHACKQDIEAIYKKYNFIIKNVFDTQIAAKFMDFGNEIGYSNLVEKLCKIKIEKAKNLQYSKWMQRPLSDKQIEYARQDVRYLHTIYFKQMEFFQKNQEKYSIFLFECQKLQEETRYKFNPLSSWSSGKFRNFDQNQKKILKQIFILREKVASKFNLPRERVISSKNIIGVLNGNVKLLHKMPKFVDKNEFLNILLSN